MPPMSPDRASRPIGTVTWDPARVDRMVSLWNQGLTAPAIARRVGVTRLGVESKLAKLRRTGVVLARRRSRIDPAPARARRACLHCGHDFDSEHVGNRLCPTCLVDGPFTSALV